MLKTTRYCIAFFLIVAFLTGCGGAAGHTPPTLTARAAVAVTRATEMSRQLRGTNAVQDAQAAATAQAIESERISAQRWLILLQDTFDTAPLDWPSGESSGEFADIVWSIQSGLFRWEATAHQGFVWWAHPTSESAGDFLLSVDVHVLEAPSSAYAGVFFHMANDDEYYGYYIRPNGEFEIDKQTQDGWVTLIPWTSNPAARAADQNRLHVLGQGNTYAFFINGALVTTLEDADFSSGYMGLIIGMDEEGDAGVFEFDNYELRVPALPATPTPD